MASNTKTVLLVPPGPPSEYGDSRHNNNAVVEHNNPIATNHKIDTRDGVSIIEQEWGLERSR